MIIKNEVMGIEICFDEEKVLCWSENFDEVVGVRFLRVKMVCGALIDVYPDSMSVFSRG